MSWQNEERLRFAIKHVQPGQLRFMCKEVGLEVVSIRRLRVGRISLGKLAIGEWRYLPVGERFECAAGVQRWRQPAGNATTRSLRTDARVAYFLLRFFLARVTSQKTTPMIATTKMMKAGDRNELSPMGIS